MQKGLYNCNKAMDYVVCADCGLVFETNTASCPVCGAKGGR